MAGIYYPTLDLFYYYAKEGLGITAAQLTPFDTYWQTLQEQHKSVGQNPFNIEIQEAIGTFDGEFKRQNFGDSNCFYLDCSLGLDDLNKSYYSPDIITKLKEKIPLPSLPKENNLYLGHTWMIYGWIDDDVDIQELAKSLYRGITDDKQDWQHHRQGQILGATVIEAWRSYQEWETPAPGSHSLIMLFPNEKAYAKATEKFIAEPLWMSLLLYRHKVWYSYEQSRLNKQNLRDNFNAIVPHLKEHDHYDFKKLREALETNQKTLAKYSIDLHNIDIHRHSLDTNLDSYNLLVEKFKITAKDACLIDHFWSNDLKFLEKFTEIANIKYEKQLERDYATLAPGLAVLTGLTETIRGLVEVQQAEIDRQQTNTIAIIGLGLAASSAFAGIAATQVYQPNNDGKEIVPWSSSETARIHWIQGLGFSLIPVATILLIWLFSKKKR